VSLTRGQLCWYQAKKRAAEATGDLQIFLQEYPSSAEEAFQFGVRSIFPIEVSNKVRNDCKVPFMVYDINWEKKKLKPINLEEWILSDELDKAQNRLIQWEQPKAGYTYVVGVDVSYGHDGGDNSAIEVVRVGNRWSKDEQVAEWCGNVDPAQVDTVAWIMGHIFLDKIDGLPAKMAVEASEGSPGIVCQTRLRERGYPNFYIMRRPNVVGGGWTKLMGWQTTSGTREPLVQTGIDAIKRAVLHVNSPFTVEEMSTFVSKMTESGKRKIEHADKYHDDRLMALFIAYYVAHEGESSSIAEERALYYQRMQEPGPKKITQYQCLPVNADDVYSKWEEEMEGFGGF
jgi:hypothetical protein